MSESGSNGSLAPNFIRKKYSRKLAVVVLLVAVVLGSGGVLVYIQTKATVSQQTADRMEYSATAQARELNRINNLLREEARLLSRSSDVRKERCPSPNKCSLVSDFLKDEVNFGGRLPDEVNGIHYVVRDSTIFASTNSGMVNDSFENFDAPWTREGGPSLRSQLDNNSDVYVSQPWNLSHGGETERVFAVISRVGLVGRQRELRYLMITVSVEDLSNAMPRPAGDGYTTVVNREGTTVLSHQSEQLLSSFPSSAYRSGDNGSALSLAQKGESGYLVAAPGGNRSAVGYAPVNGTDWVVFTHVPTNQAFAVQNQVLFNLLVLLSIAVLSLGILVAFIGRRTTQTLAQLTAKANELKEGNLDADLESDRVDEFGQLYDAFASMRDSLGNRIQEAHKARMEAEESRERVERLNSHLESKAEEYSSVMESCADGDLTARMTPESDNESMERIAREYNDMIEELERTTAQLRSFAVDVATASEEVTASVEEVRNASEQVSNTIQVISDGADRQNQKFQTVSQEMSNLSATTEEIASASNEVAEVAERSTELGKRGREQAQHAIATMEQVAREADQTVEQFERLEEEMERIDDLTDTVEEFADETNMLALNANIEASRASGEGEGDEGGFAAVAQEIKNLAAESKEAAEEADELIKSVRRRTSETAEVVKRTSDEVKDSAGTVEDAAEALDRLAEHSEMTYTGIQEINDATDQQAASAQEVVALVEDAADISDETARESESVAAASEEQTSALTEVTRNITDLAEQAARLSDRLDMFSTRSPESLSAPADDVGI